MLGTTLKTNTLLKGVKQLQMLHHNADVILCTNIFKVMCMHIDFSTFCNHPCFAWWF